MPELTQVESVKTKGFVDRGYNYDRKRKRLEEEEKEIAKLEAEARGETFEEESYGEGSEATEVQATGNSQQEETNSEVEAQEDDSNLSAEEKSFKKRYGDLRRHMQQKEKEWEEKFKAFENRMHKESIIPPKSDEDIEEWARQYPDVAGIVGLIPILIN
jgi:seryl-tRNA synthetase